MGPRTGLSGPEGEPSRGKEGRNGERTEGILRFRGVDIFVVIECAPGGPQQPTPCSHYPLHVHTTHLSDGTSGRIGVRVLTGVWKVRLVCLRGSGVTEGSTGGTPLCPGTTPDN